MDNPSFYDVTRLIFETLCPVYMKNVFQKLGKNQHFLNRRNDTF